jgi:hypothetical protein
MLKNELFIFWLAVRCQSHELVLTGVALKPGEISERRIQQAE